VGENHGKLRVVRGGKTFLHYRKKDRRGQDNVPSQRPAGGGSNTAYWMLPGRRPEGSLGEPSTIGEGFVKAKGGGGN